MSKFWLGVFVFISLVLLASHSSSFAQTSDPLAPLQLKWEKYKLQNGLRVVLNPDSSQTNVSVEFWMHTGTRDETPGKFGFAHFFEHATPYGLANDKEGVAALRANMTDSNAQVQRDFTRYFLEMKPEGVEIALRYTAERMNAGTDLYTDSWVQRHKTNVLAEIARMEGSFLGAAKPSAARLAATYSGIHPYGHGAYATVEENQSFTADELKEWHQKHYFTDNFVLFISGNFDAKNMRQLIDTHFAKVTRRGVRKPVKMSSPSVDPKMAVVKAKTEGHCLALSWPIPAWNSREAPAMQLAAQVLHARLKRAQPASVKTSGATELFQFYEFGGQFGVIATFDSLTERENVERFLIKNIEDIIRDGVSADELSAARTAAIDEVKNFQKKLGFIGSRTELLGKSLLFSNDPDHYFKRLKTQQKLTVKDVHRAASTWLKKPHSTVLIVSETTCNDPSICK